MIRVTDVLDYFTEPELLAWYLRVGKHKAEQISQEALQVGHTVDYLIQQDLRGQLKATLAETPQPYAPSVMNGLEAWKRFNHDHPTFRSTITGIQTEVSDGEVVGHPDLEMTEPSTKAFPSPTIGDALPAIGDVTIFHPGRRGIIDVKTSKAIQPKHWLQVCKYLDLKYPHALEETPFPYFVGILRLDKQTGQYEYKELTKPLDILHEVKVFDAYYLAYQHGQRIREVFRQQLEAEVFDVP